MLNLLNFRGNISDSLEVYDFYKLGNKNSHKYIFSLLLAIYLWLFYVLD